VDPSLRWVLPPPLPPPLSLGFLCRRHRPITVGMSETVPLCVQRRRDPRRVF
jgi:hypothetical protein